MLDLAAIQARRYDWWNCGVPDPTDAVPCGQQAIADRDALLAEVHRLRGALEKIRDEDCLFCGDAASDACYETARTALGGNGP